MSDELANQLREAHEEGASALRKYLADNPDDYTVLNGTIRDPGKFEGEHLYVPFFYGLGCEGFSDRDVGGEGTGVNSTWLFEITAEDRAVCAELADVTVLAIEVPAHGFINCETFMRETLDEVERVYESEYVLEEDDVPSGPAPEDYVISDARGGRYSVGQCGGRHLGDFRTMEEAHAAIREHGNKAQFWPSVWYVSDHGNATCYGTEGFEAFQWEMRGTWTADVLDENDMDRFSLTFSAVSENSAIAIQGELQSIGGARVERDGSFLNVIVDDLDAAKEELRLARFDVEER